MSRSLASVLLTVALGLTLGACSKSKPPPEVLAASKAVEKSVKTDREDMLNNARASMEGGDVSSAVEGYQRMLKGDPGNAKARLGLAEALLQSGRHDEAATQFKMLADVEGYRALSLQGQGLSLVLKGETEAGQTLLSAAVAEDPTQWRVWNALGQNWDTQKEWRRAEACYRKALEINPRADVVYNNLGMSYFMQAQYDNAIEQFNRALSLNKNLQAARLNRRLALAMLGRYDEAIEGVDPKDRHRVLNNIGYIAMLRCDLELARAYFQRATELSPAYYPTAHQNLRRADELIRRKKKC